jgi:hypothetical protein
MTQLRTVAAFDVAYKADLACTLLTEAGIPAYVTDREIVSMEWLLGNAVGGVKVQVAERDVERAEALLEERFGDSMQPFAEGVDDEELARQALAESPEDGEPEPPAEEATPTPAEGEPAPSSERDQYARRFLYAIVFSLVFLPLVFYALYLWLNAAFGNGPISSVGKRRVWIGTGIAVLASLVLIFSIGYQWWRPVDFTVIDE